jgi:hypothetical protein
MTGLPAKYQADVERGRHAAHVGFLGTAIKDALALLESDRPVDAALTLRLALRGAESVLPKQTHKGV